MMAHFGFYMAGCAVGGIGRMGLLMAWDPTDRGPDAVDDIDLSNISLYSWIGSYNSALGIARVKSKSPISIPDGDCPIFLDDPEYDYIVRFGVKAGGVGGTAIVDGWLEVFNGDTRAYGITPENGMKKIELAEGSASNAPELSMQDRLLLQALDDPVTGDDLTALLGGGLDGSEIWRELMTPNLPLSWNPF